jgi:hypothetical protein
MNRPSKTHHILFVLGLCCAAGATTASAQSLPGPTADSMPFLSWIVLGLIAGFIGSKIVNKRGRASCATSCRVLSAPSQEAGCSTCLARRV